MAIPSGLMNLRICPAWGPLRRIAPRLPLLLPALVAAFAAVTALSETPPPIRAQWIWSQGGDVRAYNQTGEVADPESFRDRLGRRAESMQQDAMFVQDPTWQFQRRQVVGDARPLVAEPAGLMYDHAEVTVVEPSAEGDVEFKTNETLAGLTLMVNGKKIKPASQSSREV